MTQFAIRTTYLSETVYKFFVEAETEEEARTKFLTEIDVGNPFEAFDYTNPGGIDEYFDSINDIEEA